MLFCPATEVNEVWEIVAKATANNELGIAAKVAPRSPLEDPRKDRLLCVYTADFSDTADVGRVLQKLRELKLVEARARPIYYKPGKFLCYPCAVFCALRLTDTIQRCIHVHRHLAWQCMGAESLYIQLDR